MIHGAGVSTDSIVFLNAADNILHHGKIYVTAYGMDEPMTHFPPLYPLLLAGISFIFRCSIEGSARFAAALTFGLNIYLIGLILRRCGISTKNAIFAILLLSLSEYMLLIHAKVFTEPLFISFMLLSFLSVEKYLRNSQTGALFLTAVTVGAACLTRYAGLPLIPMITLILLLLPGGVSFRKRLKPALIFLITAFLPLILWFIRNLLLAGTSADRGISFHPLGTAHIRQLIRSILFVFMPNSLLDNLKTASGKIVITVLGLGIISFIIFAVFAYRNLKKYSFSEMFQYVRKIDPMVKILLMFLIVYPVFLLFSISFADYTTPLSYRIMLPEFIVAFPLFTTGILILNEFSASKQRYFSFFMKIILIFFLFSYAYRAYTLCAEIHSNGLGYSTLSWKNSKLIAAVRKLPPDTPLYTNGGPGIFYQTKRLTLPIPYKYVNGKLNPEYSDKMEKMRSAITEENGVIVYFYNIPSTRMPSFTELQKEFDMQRVVETADGILIQKNQ
jgi:4-amino-4-deoxy-L-arabinose transferase-like glycosyltransferase